MTCRMKANGVKEITVSLIQVDWPVHFVML